MGVKSRGLDVASVNSSHCLAPLFQRQSRSTSPDSEDQVTLSRSFCNYNVLPPIGCGRHSEEKTFIVNSVDDDRQVRSLTDLYEDGIDMYSRTSENESAYMAIEQTSDVASSDDNDENAFSDDAAIADDEDDDSSNDACSVLSFRQNSSSGWNKPSYLFHRDFHSEPTYERDTNNNDCDYLTDGGNRSNPTFTDSRQHRPRYKYPGQVEYYSETPAEESPELSSEGTEGVQEEDEYVRGCKSEPAYQTIKYYFETRGCPKFNPTASQARNKDCSQTTARKDNNKTRANRSEPTSTDGQQHRPRYKYPGQVENYSETPAEDSPELSSEETEGVQEEDEYVRRCKSEPAYQTIKYYYETRGCPELNPTASQAQNKDCSQTAARKGNKTRGNRSEPTTRDGQQHRPRYKYPGQVEYYRETPAEDSPELSSEGTEGVQEEDEYVRGCKSEPAYQTIKYYYETRGCPELNPTASQAQDKDCSQTTASKENNEAHCDENVNMSESYSQREDNMGSQSSETNSPNSRGIERETVYGGSTDRDPKELFERGKGTESQSCIEREDKSSLDSGGERESKCSFCREAELECHCGDETDGSESSVERFLEEYRRKQELKAAADTPDIKCPDRRIENHISFRCITETLESRCSTENEIENESSCSSCEAHAGPQCSERRYSDEPQSSNIDPTNPLQYYSETSLVQCNGPRGAEEFVPVPFHLNEQLNSTKKPEFSPNSTLQLSQGEQKYLETRFGDKQQQQSKLSDMSHHLDHQFKGDGLQKDLEEQQSNHYSTRCRYKRYLHGMQFYGPRNQFEKPNEGGPHQQDKRRLRDSLQNPQGLHYQNKWQYYLDTHHLNKEQFELYLQRLDIDNYKERYPKWRRFLDVAYPEWEEYELNEEEKPQYTDEHQQPNLRYSQSDPSYSQSKSEDETYVKFQGESFHVDRQHTGCLQQENCSLNRMEQQQLYDEPQETQLYEDQDPAEFLLPQPNELLLEYAQSAHGEPQYNQGESHVQEYQDQTEQVYKDARQRLGDSHLYDSAEQTVLHNGDEQQNWDESHLEDLCNQTGLLHTIDQQNHIESQLNEYIDQTELPNKEEQQNHVCLDDPQDQTELLYKDDQQDYEESHPLVFNDYAEGQYTSQSRNGTCLHEFQDPTGLQYKDEQKNRGESCRLDSQCQTKLLYTDGQQDLDHSYVHHPHDQSGVLLCNGEQPISGESFCLDSHDKAQTLFSEELHKPRESRLQHFKDQAQIQYEGEQQNIGQSHPQESHDQCGLQFNGERQNLGESHLFKLHDQAELLCESEQQNTGGPQEQEPHGQTSLWYEVEYNSKSESPQEVSCGHYGLQYLVGQENPVELYQLEYRNRTEPLFKGELKNHSQQHVQEFDDQTGILYNGEQQSYLQDPNRPELLFNGEQPIPSESHFMYCRDQSSQLHESEQQIISDLHTQQFYDQSGLQYNGTQGNVDESYVQEQLAQTELLYNGGVSHLQENQSGLQYTGAQGHVDGSYLQESHDQTNLFDKPHQESQGRSGQQYNGEEFHYQSGWHCIENQTHDIYPQESHDETGPQYNEQQQNVEGLYPQESHDEAGLRYNRDQQNAEGLYAQESHDEAGLQYNGDQQTIEELYPQESHDEAGPQCNGDQQIIKELYPQESHDEAGLQYNGDQQNIEELYPQESHYEAVLQYNRDQQNIEEVYPQESHDEAGLQYNGDQQNIEELYPQESHDEDVLQYNGDQQNIEELYTQESHDEAVLQYNGDQQKLDGSNLQDYNDQTVQWVEEQNRELVTNNDLVVAEDDTQSNTFRIDNRPIYHKGYVYYESEGKYEDLFDQLSPGWDDMKVCHDHVESVVKQTSEYVNEGDYCEWKREQHGNWARASQIPILNTEERCEKRAINIPSLYLRQKVETPRSDKSGSSSEYDSVSSMGTKSRSGSSKKGISRSVSPNDDLSYRTQSPVIAATNIGTVNRKHTGQRALPNGGSWQNPFSNIQPLPEITRGPRHECRRESSALENAPCVIPNRLSREPLPAIPEDIATNFTPQPNRPISSPLQLPHFNPLPPIPTSGSPASRHDNLHFPPRPPSSPRDSVRPQRVRPVRYRSISPQEDK